MPLDRPSEHATAKQLVLYAVLSTELLTCRCSVGGESEINLHHSPHRGRTEVKLATNVSGGFPTVLVGECVDTTDVFLDTSWYRSPGVALIVQD